ncbi:DUF7146 domain-containing protein [Candidatus Trichorickettsia mobilis]|uniref:DUF7146 domain-containing protein n=1 Tax=Candidatus Trichorickettsia mobilis TaxID=1346319 RepID=UPI00292F0D3C|nr:toprim domain-containing protein [Candidatus Trichorickettsia mobilis]
MNNNIFTEAKSSICTESTIMTLLPKGKREGRHWLALNPIRNDNNLGSFKVNLTTGQFYDFVTGDKGSDIISLYAYLKGCSQYQAAYELLGKSINLKIDNLSHIPPKAPKSPKVNVEEYIKKIWSETWSSRCSLVEKYLKTRGVEIDSILPSIRYHGNLYHSSLKKCFPAMVAAITRYGSDKIMGLHRTYLKGDGTDKADIYPNKMMLGQMKGGAVMLASADYKLVITEGIETALSVYVATGFATWASLSASGMINIQVPPVDITRKIIIAADADAAGIESANKLAIRLLDEGYKVSIAKPL